MTISRSVEAVLESSSWIRKMFETGKKLKLQHGEENVFDFSLGNTITEPPPQFDETLRHLVNNPPPGMHGYMANTGYVATREAVAKSLGAQEGLEVAPEDITMTVGAAGAMNVALSSILDPDEEVIILSPYFVEYIFYIKNHRGRVRIVESTEDFDLNLSAVADAITPRTKAIIINTPNNPTGRVYSQETINRLGEILARGEAKHSTTIYLIVDTPYGRITFNGHKNPLLFTAHPSTLIAHSFSKELGLAGERIGYLAVNPEAPHRKPLQAATAFKNRTLGFVNAPALMQRALEHAVDSCIDPEVYRKRRDQLCQGLGAAGYDFFTPQGAFYLFPRTPIDDDVLFAQELAKENVLVVPGKGFGREGYMRIAFCVSEATIAGALPHFAHVIQRFK